MKVLEAFHTIKTRELLLRSKMFLQKEQYRQIFLISHETEIKEMFERVVEL